MGVGVAGRSKAWVGKGCCCCCEGSISMWSAAEFLKTLAPCPLQDPSLVFVFVFDDPAFLLGERKGRGLLLCAP